MGWSRPPPGQTRSSWFGPALKPGTRTSRRHGNTKGRPVRSDGGQDSLGPTAERSHRSFQQNTKQGSHYKTKMFVQKSRLR